MSRASGDVIAWINSDDVYFPGALQCMALEFSSKADIDVIYGDGDVIDDSGMRSWWWRSKPHCIKDHRSYCFLWNDFLNHILQPACFWRKGVVETIGALDESFCFAMDHEYWVRMGFRGCRFHHVRRPIARFRLIAGTKSLSSPTVFWLDELEIQRRYRGAASLEPVLAYYLYNLAIHDRAEFDVFDQGFEALRRRFAHCDQSEWEVVALRFDEGKGRACLLLAKHLFQSGDMAKAQTFLKAGLLKRPDLARSHVVLRCFAYQLFGGRIMGRFERIEGLFFGQFRKAFHRGNAVAEFLLRGAEYGL